jgi:hypothetical protein
MLWSSTGGTNLLEAEDTFAFIKQTNLESAASEPFSRWCIGPL